MVGIGTLLAALAMYIGCSFQSNTTIQQNRFSDDKIVRLNNTFYEEKRFFFTPKIKETKFLHAYKEAIGEMKQCQIDTKLLRYFYGESGIGKTTMLHEVLKDSKPFPYTLLRLESGNSWKEVGVKLNITSINEHATEELVFRTLTEYFNYLNSDDCPLIIIDGANRNPKITNTFIAFWRDISHVRPFALLMISSDGFYPSISRGGGRVIGTELSPSETFVREYLEAKGIVDPSLVSEIMEITGNKIVYLSSIRSPRELNILEQTVYENFEENLMELKRFDMAFQYFKNLVKVLLENPQQSMAALDVVPDKEAAKIFKSNLLRSILVSMKRDSVESADATCYDTVSINSFDSNSVSDLRCSPSTYALSNRRGGYIQGSFNYVPKGKVILGSKFTINLKYMFSSCDTKIKHNSSLIINDQYVMDIPFDGSQCNCLQKEFSLSPTISSYLMLNPTNTLKITSSISTSTEIYISDVKIKFCYISQSTTIANLKLENSLQTISILTPESYKQIKTEPFKDILSSKTSNLTSVPYVITNSAVDIVENITLTVSLTGSFAISNYLIVDVQLQKIGPNGGNIIISPSISKSSSLYSKNLILSRVNLQNSEKLIASLVIESIKEDSITSGVNLELAVSATNPDTVELSDNTKIGLPFQLFLSKAYLSENEKSAGPIYNAGPISDLAYMDFQPLVTSPFNPACWLQLNMIINGNIPAFIGNIHIWSSKSKTQFTKFFQYSHFIGSTLFMAIPSDQLDCNPATSTKLYMRVETNLPFSYRMYISRKVYSSVSSLSKSVSNIFTPKLEKGEGFAVSVDNLYDPTQDGFEKVPLNFQLPPLNIGSSRRFNAFLTKRSSNPTIFRSVDAIAVPINPFPNAILDTQNLLYYFENDCIDCTLNLYVQLPDSIKNPPSLLPNSNIDETQLRNDYGIYWKYVDVSSVSTASKYAVATITVNNVAYQSKKNIKLLATQNRIDSTYSSSLRTIETTTDYIQTTDCSSSNLGNYRSSISVPTISGGIWKFGFFIDPIVMLNSVSFSISQYSSVRSISSNALTNVEALRVPEFVYSFSFDCSSCKQTWGKTNMLSFTMLADTLQLENRYYEIFLKIGDIPTPTSHDIKSGYISTKMASDTIQIFKPRYIFSLAGTAVVNNNGETSFISSNRLDDIGTNVHVLIKEVPGTLFSTETSCLAKNQSSSFSYQYETATTVNSESSTTVLNDYSFFSIDATKMIFNDTNIGKNLTVEISTSSFIGLNPVLIHPVTGKRVTMKRTLLKYRFSGNSYQFQKYAGSFSITRDVVNQVKGAALTMVLLPDRSDKTYYSSISSLSVTTFVQQDFDSVSYFNPLIDDRYLSCVQVIQNGYSNLTLNDVPYLASSKTYEYISSSAIILAKINCPKSEIIIVNDHVKDANDIGVVGICLGLILLYMGLAQITAPFCKRLVKRIRNSSSPKNSRKNNYKASTTATTNATIAVPKTSNTTSNNNSTSSRPVISSTNTTSSTVATTTANTTSTNQSNAQTEFQRREEELVRNLPVQLEPQAQPYINEIELPNIPIPNFKQPSVPSQPIGDYRPYNPNDMILENITPQIQPPNYDSPSTNSQVFIYDSSIAPAAQSNFTSYNPTANADDYVAFYQRSDNLPANNNNNNNNGNIGINFDNPNNV
ncbi:predicted protein [Naegleria gruberi]|uniref:Predicted protein n=1 Tax=Naegleria gruberi TaxID=5762 RepID=D2VCL1_NAEGR|nr:uncharacterized protein NAEGRDRAFT_48451 [Naegleria gruberi]EFC45330.1 predicted protein [Naegleria gruberi]|eukprot:XP_002678074.1 predicted protein [Naegleria gruberi strain NEG-M]